MAIIQSGDGLPPVQHQTITQTNADFFFTHWGFSNLDHHWLRYWLVAWSAPSHYLNQSWNIVNWNLGNKLQWNLKRNSNIFIQENAFENIWKMAAILSWPQCVKKFGHLFESSTCHTFHLLEWSHSCSCLYCSSAPSVQLSGLLSAQDRWLPGNKQWLQSGLILGLRPANERRGLILGLRPANERRRYKVTPSLIGWVQTYSQPWLQSSCS